VTTVAGGADPRRGSGLTGLKDRVEALGGTFSVHSPAGGGTTVCCELPVMAGGGQPDAGPGEEPVRPGGSPSRRRYPSARRRGRQNRRGRTSCLTTSGSDEGVFIT